MHEKILRKTTFFEASHRVQTLLSSKPNLISAGISSEDEKKLRSIIKLGMKQAGASYSSKNVRTSLRKYFDPLRLVTGALLPDSEERVLYVDDLLATGETLLAAESILSSRGNRAVSRSVTWFSKV